MPSLNQITQLLESACAVHVFSGASLYAEHQGRSLEHHCGVTTYWPGATSVTSDTIFDIGSITKAITTGSTFARLFSRSALSFSDTLGKLVPEFKNSKFRDLRVEDLLSHSSGIGDWFPMYRERGKVPVKQWLLAEQDRLIAYAPREKAIYSDFGFLLLGMIIEQIYGGILPAFEAEVKKPLELSEVYYGPITPATQVAATEFDESLGAPLHGVVFDENCRSLGGIGPHAGLFATARGLAPFCRGWLKAVAGDSNWIDAKIAKKMAQPAGLVKGSTWAYGFDTKSPAGSSAGQFFSPQSFGHLGYPGCSIWMDPITQGFAIFLTNRVHPSRYDERIRKLRPLVHDEIAKWWRTKS